jgi:hypothetical protein
MKVLEIVEELQDRVRVILLLHTLFKVFKDNQSDLPLSYIPHTLYVPD